MEIIALADIHGDLDFLPAIGEQIGRADLVLIAGDITNFGGRREAREVLTELTRYNPHIFAVPGNCDGPSVNQFLFESHIDLHCRRVDFQQVSLLGLCSWLACPHEAASSYDPKTQLNTCLDWLGREIPADRPAIFVSHQPPFGTAVDASPERHSGSQEIRHFLERYHPILSISGHIHEGRAYESFGSTVLVNPGPFRKGYYALIHVDGTACAVELFNV